jgi:hypothetical protein
LYPTGARAASRGDADEATKAHLCVPHIHQPARRDPAAGRRPIAVEAAPALGALWAIRGHARSLTPVDRNHPQSRWNNWLDHLVP